MGEIEFYLFRLYAGNIRGSCSFKDESRSLNTWVLQKNSCSESGSEVTISSNQRNI